MREGSDRRHGCSRWGAPCALHHPIGRLTSGTVGLKRGGWWVVVCLKSLSSTRAPPSLLRVSSRASSAPAGWGDASCATPSAVFDVVNKKFIAAVRNAANFGAYQYGVTRTLSHDGAQTSCPCFEPILMGAAAPTWTSPPKWASRAIRDLNPNRSLMMKTNGLVSYVSGVCEHALMRCAQLYVAVRDESGPSVLCLYGTQLHHLNSLTHACFSSAGTGDNMLSIAVDSVNNKVGSKEQLSTHTHPPTHTPYFLVLGPCCRTLEWFRGSTCAVACGQ